MKAISLLPTLLAIAAPAFLGSCKEKAWSDDESQLARSPGAKLFGVAKGDTVKLDNGLVIEQIEVGEGAEAKTGMRVKVHYTGRLTNGTKFDSSRDRNEPFEILLGAGQVIKGWDIGLQGMKPGGKRKLTIPADLAYGDRVQAEIPANSTLVFDVEMVSVN
ncbi:FKBP-type peptidyl-prolyl cis-trans isomerase [Arenicella sp.]|nr:FKBP-type peptidyl-prolyl cis-trans isomerase [Arenicella sp.]